MKNKHDWLDFGAGILWCKKCGSLKKITKNDHTIFKPMYIDKIKSDMRSTKAGTER